MQYTERDLETMFDDMLDECYPVVKFGCLEYMPSQVLKEVDPIAYREEYLTYIDSMLDEVIFEHSDGSYHDEPEEEIA